MKYYYDEEAAERAVFFFHNFLIHFQGKWAGEPFVLLEWQEQIIRDIFGWKREDGTRKYRTVYVEVPRKNGKTTLAAGIALYLLFGDKEPGCEVYSAAADREQAALVFEIARKMVEASPGLSERSQQYRRSIVYPKIAGSYKVLSADVPTKYGLNAHGIIFDELHTQPNRDLWDVLLTSTGAREQPLVVAITTAGFDRESICYEQHEYTHKVNEKIIDDPTFYGVIYSADEEEDWESPEVWEKANPSLGQTVRFDYIEQECSRAKETPAYQNTFRREHLNQWTQSETRWIDLSKWDATAGLLVKDQLAGKPCIVGLDLASVNDIAALVQVFPLDKGRYKVIPHFFIPKENALKKEKSDRVPYTTWARKGFVDLTPGNVIDYSYIEKKFDKIAKECKIIEVAYDPWNADMFIQHLQEGGVTVVPIRQGYASMTAPSKYLETLILEKKIIHGANPVLRWMIDNVVVEIDPAGNIKPSKKKSTQRIDGVVALINALARCIEYRDKPMPYQDRGISFL